MSAMKPKHKRHAVRCSYRAPIEQQPLLMARLDRRHAKRPSVTALGDSDNAAVMRTRPIGRPARCRCLADRRVARRMQI